MLRQSIAVVIAGFIATSAIGGAPAYAEQCRDAAGKFIKCPPKPEKAVKCRDKTTKKFAKCDAPNTEPVPSK